MKRKKELAKQSGLKYAKSQKYFRKAMSYLQVKNYDRLRQHEYKKIMGGIK